MYELNELHYLDLHELAYLIDRRDVSPTEVTRHQLARIAALDPSLGAFIEVIADQATVAAEGLEQELLKGHSRGPLHGVPVAVKDNIDVTGVATTAGMPFRRATRATQDATTVRRLRSAGAVILGKLNLTEGALADYTPPFKAPLNPWDADRYPGASSSGSAIATAAGLCFGTLATDTGASIRVPSAVNGVTGLKPTWGRVSRHGVFELAATLDHVGPICRTAADVATMLGVIAGADPSDPTAEQVDVPNYAVTDKTDLRGLRVGVDVEWNQAGVDHGTAQGMLNAVATLESLGAEVVEVAFPDPSQMVDDWFVACAVETAFAHRATFPVHRDTYGPTLTRFIENGRSVSSQEYQAVLLHRLDYRGRLSMLFQKVDILAMPAMAFAAPSMDEMEVITNETISGLHRFTCEFDMTGNPTLTAPSGLNEIGLPVAVQFIGSHFAEQVLLRAGIAFQSVTTHHRNRPPIS